jgi:sugar/nucleoside kinase (ribokinase family)
LTDKTTDNQFDIVGLGTIVIDHLAMLDAHPKRDTKNAVVCDHMQVGGPVPTALAMLGRLGRTCSFIGRWGDDPFGQMIERDLQAQGIDMQLATRQPGTRTGFAHVWVCGETASRTIAYHRPEETVSMEAAAYWPLLSRARALHLDGWPGPAALAAAREARRHEALVSLDAGSPKSHMAELIPLVDVLNVPRRFLHQWFGHDDIARGLRALQAEGPRWVTITDGHHGAWLAHEGQHWHQPAPAIEAIDTTGAGDVFSGVLLHNVLAGASPQRVLSQAVAAAALKCQALGNRDALPALTQIENTATPLPAPIEPSPASPP